MRFSLDFTLSLINHTEGRNVSSVLPAMPTMVKTIAQTAAKAVSAREKGISTAASSSPASVTSEDMEEVARVSFCTSQM